jgi:hypothetical protein
LTWSGRGALLLADVREGLDGEVGRLLHWEVGEGRQHGWGWVLFAYVSGSVGAGVKFFIFVRPLLAEVNLTSVDYLSGRVGMVDGRKIPFFVISKHKQKGIYAGGSHLFFL